MRIFKYVGITILILAFVMALGIIGRVETEDRQYRSGEIEQEEMTEASDLVWQILICGGVAVLGGAIWAISAYIEAGRVERIYLRKAR
jgi:hypothetical protein